MVVRSNGNGEYTVKRWFGNLIIIVFPAIIGFLISFLISWGIYSDKISTLVTEVSTIKIILHGDTSSGGVISKINGMEKDISWIREYLEKQPSKSTTTN